MSSVDNSFLNNDELNVQLIGSVNHYWGKYYFSQNLNINTSEYIDLLVSNVFKDEEIKINNLNMNSINLNTFTLDGSFHISNSNNLTYEIKNINIEFYKTSTYENKIGDTELNSGFIIQPDTVNNFDFSLNLKTKDFGGLFLSTFFKEERRVYVKINTLVFYNNISFPFSIYDEITF